MKKLLTLFVCLAGLAVAQLGRDYTVSYSTSLVAAANAVTIQQPATGSKVVRFAGAYVYCSAECQITVERDGAAATATAATVVPIRTTTAAAVTKAFTSSDVGTGTVLGAYTIPPGGSQTIDLSMAGLYGDGTGKNLTVRIASMTGAIKVVIQFTEVQ
jgi:hypothetical protein